MMLLQIVVYWDVTRFSLVEMYPYTAVPRRMEAESSFDISEDLYQTTRLTSLQTMP